MKYNLIDDLKLRRARIIALLHEANADAILLSGNTNLAYLTGEIFDGYYYIDKQGHYACFVRSGNLAYNEHCFAVSKPEMILQILKSLDENIEMPSTLVLEDDDISAREWFRLSKVFDDCQVLKNTDIMKNARKNKTPFEIQCITHDALYHCKMYEDIPSLYRPGMTDLQFTADIEHMMRSRGHIGIMRTSGFKMEGFMGVVLTGKNAAVPTPYDIALGGKGISPYLPMGVCNTEILPNTTVLVDITGNYSGYIIEISRTYCVGNISNLAKDAHATAIDIQNLIMRNATPGIPCNELYELALGLVTSRKLQHCFMGTQKQAKFIGHGLGLELNESPVISDKFKKPLEIGALIALEPKFVIEDVGAVGIENTLLMTHTGLVNLTPVTEQIVQLA